MNSGLRGRPACGWLLDLGVFIEVSLGQAVSQMIRPAKTSADHKCFMSKVEAPARLDWEHVCALVGRSRRRVSELARAGEIPDTVRSSKSNRIQIRDTARFRSWAAEQRARPLGAPLKRKPCPAIAAINREKLSSYHDTFAAAHRAYVKVVKADWRRGKLLCELKSALPKGQFNFWCEQHLKISTAFSSPSDACLPKKSLGCAVGMRSYRVSRWQCSSPAR